MADGVLTHLHGAIAQLFYDFVKYFFIATLLSHFSLLIAQSFFIVALLSHFAQTFFIEQGHSFTKWLSRTDGITHSFMRS
jgi:hypothetical protein